MRALVFEANSRAPVSAPERADIACFVGFVLRSPRAVSAQVQQWLFENGWLSSGAREALTDVPVPLERWDDFLWHFDGADTYLGAAVRSFFTQGGRKCYVVRVRDPWEPGTSRGARAPWVEALLPGTGALFDASPHERTTWSGAAHLLGLPDVSFLGLPDLSAALAVDALPVPPAVEPPGGPEVFVECSAPSPELPELRVSEWTAPRCDESAYGVWADFLARVKALLSRHVREVQLVAAVPLPFLEPGSGGDSGVLAESPYAFLLAEGHLAKFESAFVQLVYPWARTPGSASLPEGLESPEGLFIGVLARGALLRGTFRGVKNQGLADVEALFPGLGRDVLSSQPSSSARPLLERVSVLGPAPRGLQVLSDVTTSPSEGWRQAPVNRLMSVLTRAARRSGLAVVFQPSVERTWRELVYRLETVLERLWELGALRGSSARESFSIRCDRTTMTQEDLDAGRLKAEVAFDPSQPIERIHVLLTVAEEGVLSLSAEGAS